VLTNSIRLVLDGGNHGWILEKIAIRLQAHISELGITCDIAAAPSHDASVNFWMQYTDRTLMDVIRTSTIPPRFKALALVTHVDESFKLARIKQLEESGVGLMFMSEFHAKEIKSMLNYEKDFWTALIPSDHNSGPRKFRIGLVSKWYPDGRKNESWIIDFAKMGLLDNCEFSVVGQGWEETVSVLRSYGVECRIFNGVEDRVPDYLNIKEYYDYIDLYIYFGFDEGALGSLDAYVFKRDLLVSRQGFHTEFILDENSFVDSQLDAQEKFILKKKNFEQWAESLSKWTWNLYVENLMGFIDIHNKELNRPNYKMNRYNVNLDLFKSSAGYRKMLPRTLRRMFLVRIPRKLRSFFQED